MQLLFMIELDISIVGCCKNDFTRVCLIDDFTKSTLFAVTVDLIRIDY